MFIEEALVSYLKADGGVSALISSRLFPLSWPQQDPQTGDSITFPTLTYMRMSGQDFHVLSSQPNLHKATFQFQAWGIQYADAKALNEAVFTALNGFRGFMLDVPVQSILSANRERDMRDPETQLYRVISEYTIFYN